MPTRSTPDPFAMKIGARLRALRQEQKLSLADLARSSGLSKGHASNLENGLVLMNLGTAQALARGLSLPLFVLFLLPEEDAFSAEVESLRIRAKGDLVHAATILRKAAFESPRKKPKSP